MPPGQQINPSDLSWATAKKVCSAADIERLACAFLSATGKVDYDADKAARDFGGGAKGDSFKRSIWVICKKIKEAKDGDGDGGDGDDGGQAKKGKKRKAETNGEGDGGVAKKGRGKKKKTSEVVKEEPVEDDGGDEDDGLL